MARFLLTAFFLSACASGRLHYVNKPGKRDVVTEKRQDVGMNDVVENENSVMDGSGDSLISENAGDALLIEQKSVKPAFTDRLINNVEKNYAEDIPEIRPHLEKLKQMRSDSHPKEKSERESAGQVLIIVGLILAVLSVFFFLKAENVSNNSGTVDGCAQSVMDSIMYTIWGMIFGIGGAVLILIGVIFIITSRKNVTESTINSSGE